MDYNQMQMTIETIKRMKNSGVFINYIEYIDFPFYKNLISRTRINFEFPMTVLIGKMVLERARHCMLYSERLRDIHVVIFGFDRCRSYSRERG